MASPMIESSIDASWRTWRNELETLRIMMGTSESSSFLILIVATSRADVQRSVSVVVIWTEARKPFHGMEIQFLRTTTGGGLSIITGLMKSSPFHINSPNVCNFAQTARACSAKYYVV